MKNSAGKIETERGTVNIVSKEEGELDVARFVRMACKQAGVQKPSVKKMFRLFEKSQQMCRLGDILAVNSFNRITAKPKLAPLLPGVVSFLVRGHEGEVNWAQAESGEISLDHVFRLMVDMLRNGLNSAPNRCKIKGMKKFGSCSGRHRLIVLDLLFGLDVMVPVVLHREQKRYEAAVVAVNIQSSSKRKVTSGEDSDAKVTGKIRKALETDPKLNIETMERLAEDILTDEVMDKGKNAKAKTQWIGARLLEMKDINLLKKYLHTAKLRVSNLIRPEGTKAMTVKALKKSASNAIGTLSGNSIEKMMMLELGLTKWDRVVFSMHTEFSRMKGTLDVVSLDSLGGVEVKTCTGSRTVQEIVVSTRAARIRTKGNGSMDGVAMGSLALDAVGWCIKLMDGKAEERFMSAPENDERLGRQLAKVMMDYISNSGQENIGRTSGKQYRKVIFEKVYVPYFREVNKGMRNIKTAVEAERSKAAMGDGKFNSDIFLKYCKTEPHVYWEEIEDEEIEVEAA